MTCMPSHSHVLWIHRSVFPLRRKKDTMEHEARSTLLILSPHLPRTNTPYSICSRSTHSQYYPILTCTNSRDRYRTTEQTRKVLIQRKNPFSSSVLRVPRQGFPCRGHRPCQAGTGVADYLATAGRNARIASDRRRISGLNW